MITEYIKKFELDSRDLHYHQFIVAKVKNEIVGFGRIKKQNACDELCSLGVIESERLKGVGKQLVTALINVSKQPLFLVCIIPDFFKPLGFNIASDYPEELEQKLNYCTRELMVKEPYVVMKLTS